MSFDTKGRLMFIYGTTSRLYRVSLQDATATLMTGVALSSAGLAIYRDCNGNGVYDSHDIVSGASLDSNSDGIPDECTFCNDDECDPIENSCNCPEDCGGPAATEITGATCQDGLDNDCDLAADCDDSDCAVDLACIVPSRGDDSCIGGGSAGQPCGMNSDCPGGACQLKNRFVSTVLPATANAHGMKVQLVGIDANSVATPANYVGTDRWAGPPSVNVNDGVTPPFNAAKLECAFVSQDWSAVGLVHIYGDIIVPLSWYDVSTCFSATGPCSTALRIGTARWGDIIAPMGVTNFQDITSIVAKFQGNPSGPSKTRTKLAEPVNPVTAVNFQEISADVAAFQGKAYKQVFPTPPATCP